MQRIGQNEGLCHGEQKANSYNSKKNSLKMFVVVVVVEVRFFVQMDSQTTCEQSGAQEAIAEASTDQVRRQFVYMKVVCGTGLLRWQNSCVLSVLSTTRLTLVLVITDCV